MSYGITFQNIKKVLKPENLATAWGTRAVCASRPEYHMERLAVREGACVPAGYDPGSRTVYFVEEGEVVAHVRDRAGAPSLRRVGKGQLVTVDAGLVHGFRAGAKGATMYAFSRRSEAGVFAAESQSEADLAWRGRVDLDIAPSPEKTQDFRDKYWGTIETIWSEDVAGKRIFLKKGGQASLEFHVKKIEAYYVHSGRVRVGVRTGRAENRSIVLSAGEAFEVPPGLMHMRIALEDTLIIEVSTRDDDGDSHLVEDGMKYTHVDVVDP